jgi:hypothetical protein
MEVSNQLRLLYSQGKGPQYSFVKQLNGHQGGSGHGGEDENILPLPDIETQVFGF